MKRLSLFIFVFGACCFGIDPSWKLELEPKSFSVAGAGMSAYDGCIYALKRPYLRPLYFPFPSDEKGVCPKVSDMEISTESIPLKRGAFPFEDAERARVTMTNPVTKVRTVVESQHVNDGHDKGVAVILEDKKKWRMNLPPVRSRIVRSKENGDEMLNVEICIGLRQLAGTDPAVYDYEACTPPAEFKDRCHPLPQCHAKENAIAIVAIGGKSGDKMNAAVPRWKKRDASLDEAYALSPVRLNEHAPVLQ